MGPCSEGFATGPWDLTTLVNPLRTRLFNSIPCAPDYSHPIPRVPPPTSQLGTGTQLSPSPTTRAGTTPFYTD